MDLCHVLRKLAHLLSQEEPRTTCCIKALKTVLMRMANNIIEKLEFTRPNSQLEMMSQDGLSCIN